MTRRRPPAIGSSRRRGSCSGARDTAPTSISDILETAKVNSGSLYCFFKGKQELLIAVPEAEPSWGEVKIRSKRSARCSVPTGGYWSRPIVYTAARSAAWQTRTYRDIGFYDRAVEQLGNYIDCLKKLTAKS